MKFLIAALFIGAITLQAQTLAVVNSENISLENVNSFLKTMNKESNYDKLDTKEKNLILHQVIEKKLLTQEAIKEKLNDNKEFKATLEELKSSLLVEFFMKSEFDKIKVEKSEVENYYNAHLYEFKQDKKIKARHIIVEDLKLAMDIIEKLNKAKNKEEEFVTLASNHSLDGSAASGGDLGWFQKGEMIDEFWDAASNLKPQEYTKNPVKSEFGFHIIFLDEIQEPLTIKLEQAYSNIQNQIKMDKFQSIIDEKIKGIKKDAMIIVK